MNNENRIIRLEGALNVRELGGLPLKNGGYVKHGTLIRAGRLSDLTENDRQILRDQWHVTTIIDLRNNQEISEHPDMELDGANIRQISILAGEKEGVSREDFGMSMIDIAILRAKHLYEDGGAGNLLKGMYGQMAESPYCMERIRDFFSALCDQKEGSFLWHCTSGKDRTGVTGALLLYALGADLDTIQSDYLYTNEQNKAYRDNLLHLMEERGAGEELVEEMRILESVDWSYIENFFNTIETAYGSIDQFLQQEIGLTAEKKEFFLNKFTERTSSNQR